MAAKGPYLNVYFEGLPATSFEQGLLKEKGETFKEMLTHSHSEFWRVPEQEEHQQSCQRVFHHFKDKKKFFHVGMGGSSLGAEMLVDALRENHCPVDFSFINNSDPDHLTRQLHEKDFNIHEALFYFVSKSGKTVETMANLMAISRFLKTKGILEEEFKNYFVFATTLEEGPLWQLGQKWNILILPIPPHLGGRFSVLSCVGLFPALFAGLDLSKLCAGAKSLKGEFLSTPLQESPLLLTSFHLFELWKKKIHQTVFMPYSSRLKTLSSWFVQLWAESLGKEGKGLTPLAAHGATDQHSQMQLFMDGPKDKCLLILEILQFCSDHPLDPPLDMASLKYLNNTTLAQLLKAQLRGTLKALKEKNRPHIHFTLSHLNESSLGALIFFLESLTVLMGHHLEINPFNQPGVERAKEYALQSLSQL